MDMSTLSDEQLLARKCELEQKLSELKAITTEEQNNLSDDAFAYIGKGGTKDETGKTIPRNLRKLPIHDKAHVIAAKAAMMGARGGVDIPAEDKAMVMKKINAALKKYELEPMPMTEGMKEEVELHKINMAQFKEVFELNDKLISSLKDEETKTKVLESTMNSMKDQLNEKDQIITQFKTREEQAKITVFNNKLDHISKKWLSAFNLKDTEYSGIRSMLSSFSSEDKLEQVSRFLDVQFQKQSEQPQVVTQLSSTLQSEEVKQIDYGKMSRDEKMDYLFSKLK